MGSMYDLKLDRELGKPVLPQPTDPLRDQREAARAIRVLFPGTGVKLFSVRMQDGSRVVRELEV